MDKLLEFIFGKVAVALFFAWFFICFGTVLVVLVPILLWREKRASRAETPKDALSQLLERRGGLLLDEGVLRQLQKLRGERLQDKPDDAIWRPLVGSLVGGGVLVALGVTMTLWLPPMSATPPIWQQHSDEFKKWQKQWQEMSDQVKKSQAEQPERDRKLKELLDEQLERTRDEIKKRQAGK
jgi:hypothetical protein